MTLHVLPPRNASKPKPHEGIVDLLRGLLAAAEAGDIVDIAAVWGTSGQAGNSYFTSDRLWLGGAVYGLMHELLTGEDE